MLTAGAVAAAVVLSAALNPVLKIPGNPYISITPEQAQSREIKVFDTRAGQIIKMPLEDYVFHGLAGEMPVSFEPQALAAQACAIRTYVAYKIQHGGCSKHKGADVCTDYTSCLAFKWDSDMDKWGDKADQNEEKLHKAVADTKGEIIEYRGQPIDALFFSNAGGKTDDVQNVFGGNLAYLKGVDSYEKADSANYETTVQFSKKDFFEKISKEYPNITGGEIKIVSRDESGRVKTVQIGAGQLTGTQMRETLGLNSTNFTIAAWGDQLTFDVKGYGHGVGLSQWGAEEMAREGYNYKSILKHYYTGVDIVMAANF